MKRSEHFNVVAGKWLNGYSLSVNGLKYVMYGVDLDNRLVLRQMTRTLLVTFLIWVLILLTSLRMNVTV